MEGPRNVLGDPEVAVAVVAQEDHCGRGLGDLAAAWRQVEGRLEHQLPLGVGAAGLGLVGGLVAGRLRAHQNLLPVG